MEDVSSQVSGSSMQLKLRNSALGIISLVLALWSFVFTIIGAIAVFGWFCTLPIFNTAVRYGSRQQFEPLGTILLYIGIISFLLTAIIEMIGIILGIIGFLTKDCKKILALIGIILNAVPIIFIVIGLVWYVRH